MCGITVKSVRSGVTRIRIGNAPCGIRVRGTPGTMIGPMIHPMSADPTPTPTAMMGPTTASANGSNIGSPLPKMVLSVGMGINSAMGGKRAVVVLRTVGVRGGVGTSGSNGVATVGMDGKRSILRNASLMVVRWCKEVCRLFERWPD